MRRAAAGAAVLLLLAGCGPSADPSNGEPTSPSPAASTAQARQADLGAVCDALNQTVKLPADGTVRYTATFNKSTGWATNAPICDIEPVGTYDEVATKAAAFGRAKFNYGILTEEQIQQLGYPTYTPETAQKLLTLDEAEPLTDEIPCATEPCKNGIHGYLYSFRFETVMDDIGVIAQFDYITTDVNGDKQPQYRTQAIGALTTSMETIAAELK
ncbi:hypothetical protein DFJ67_6999 [Asanoa ferruginea]|uniref:PknH-like protein n=1 Tax=Asanoa ferruginea TaxID=53367 RepID=A0A3D9ZXP3_9ACTN|nr:hypothetical protein [Asanoa ferruginea]REG00934.1 hypothetical protein DFJ67_6999 [Asanoa ferruginea]GIF47525.1 hypothetical protein Afe04nite_20640 [Asanoa ferruginea]